MNQIDRVFDRFVVDLLIDCSIDCLIDCLTDLLIDCLIDWLIDLLIYLLIDQEPQESLSIYKYFLTPDRPGFAGPYVNYLFLYLLIIINYY